MHHLPESVIIAYGFTGPFKLSDKVLYHNHLVTQHSHRRCQNVMEFCSKL